MDEIQRSIRTAALEVFRRQGFGGLNLRAIAVELGWSATALYRYYASKEDLLNAIRVQGFRRMGDDLRAAKDAASTPIDAYRGAMRAVLDFAKAEPELFRLMFELNQADYPSSADVRSERKRSFAVAEEIASQCIDAGLFSGTPTLVAHLMWIGCHGLAALWMAQQLDLGCSYEELIEPTLNQYTLLNRSTTGAA